MTEHRTGSLDTDAVVPLELLPPDDLPAEPVIATVTLAGLSVGPLVTDDPAEQAAHRIRLQETAAAFDPPPFDAASARAFDRGAAGLRRSGRRVQPRALDAMIAVVAIAHDLPVYTCNARDFAGVDGLTVVVLPHPDRN